MNNPSAFGNFLNLLRKKKRAENYSKKKKIVFHMKRSPCEERGEGFIYSEKRRYKMEEQMMQGILKTMERYFG